VEQSDRTRKHPILRTRRLVLRQWQDADLDPFSAMQADPRVMEFYPSYYDRIETAATIARFQQHFIQHGFGRWVVEVPGVAAFVGCVGLAVVTFDAHFTPSVEVGWRLAFEHWGKGFATEAAQASIDFAFEQLNLNEIVSFTTPVNQRSRNVMERLGMKHAVNEDFDHPNLSPGHPLRRHVLYRLSQSDWKRSNLASSIRLCLTNQDPRMAP
jgi:RimJ/RimL family protein N-acetyltransferase